LLYNGDGFLLVRTAKGNVMKDQKTNSNGSDKRLHDLGSEINRMGAMAADALAKARATGFQALESLISKQDATRERMRGVGEASGDAWHELKQGLEAAWGDLHGAVQGAISKFQQREMHDRGASPKKATATSAPAKSTKSAKPAKSAKKKASQSAKKKPTASARGRSSKRK
jgi:hypothetical protein